MTAESQRNRDRAQRLIDCYNAKDFGGVRELLHPAMTFVHHATMAFDCADDLINLQQGVARLFSDRQWTSRRSWGDGNAVVTQGTWIGMADEDVPGRAKKGQHMTMEFCAVFTFDDGGRIVRWEDYGAPVVDRLGQGP